MDIEGIIKHCSKEWIAKYSSNTLENLVQQMEKYLESNPNDVTMIIRLAIAAHTRPFCDDTKALEWLATIPSNHFLYPKALLVEAWVKEGFDGTTEEYAPKLLACKTNNKEEESILHYMASRCYDLDTLKYKELIFHSVSLNDKYVWNNVDLGRWYLRQRDYKRGEHFILKGLHNIQKMGCSYAPDDDITDIEEFINSRIKGVDITKPLYEWIVEDLLRIHPAIPSSEEMCN